MKKTQAADEYVSNFKVTKEIEDDYILTLLQFNVMFDIDFEFIFQEFL